MNSQDLSGNQRALNPKAGLFRRVKPLSLFLLFNIIYHLILSTIYLGLKDERIMATQLKDIVLAVIALKPEKVKGGGAPIFIAEDSAEQEKIALNLSRVLNGAIHDLENGVFLIVGH